VEFPRATETYGASGREQPRDWSSDVPAHISSVTGTVTLEREGKLEPAEANVPLLSGDRLRTRSASRVEVLFADGSAFTLDEDSDLDLLSESLIRLLEGQMRLAIVRATTTLDYRVDAPAASVWIRAAGDYRLSARARRSEKPEVVLTVLRGSAELVNEHGRSTVRAGQEALATPDLAPSLAYDINSAAGSEFDMWTEDRRDSRVGTTSTKLPAVGAALRERLVRQLRHLGLSGTVRVRVVPQSCRGLAAILARTLDLQSALQLVLGGR
jgi:hypothetical protein